MLYCAVLCREKAEAEKRAAAERAGAIKELLAELSDEYKEKQLEARDTAKAVK